MSELNLPQITTQNNVSSYGSSATDTRLQEQWLLLARTGWIGVVVPMYALFVAYVPAYFASLHILQASNVQTFTGQLTLTDVHTLQVRGLSLDFYATCMVVVSLLFQCSYATVGILLFWQKSDDRIALFTSFALMMLPFGFANFTLQGLPPDWSWLIPLLSAFGNASLLLCAFIFPDGRFVPRWTRWLALVMLGYWVIVAFLPSWQLHRSWLSLILFFSFALAVMLLQLHRYHYQSTPQQRQQTKWALFGVAIAVAGNIGPRLLYSFVLLPLSNGSALAFALESSLIMISMLAIPFTLGLAILQDRLWDIDVIINRTLIYGGLSGTLAAVYVGLIIGLQSLASAITGQGSQSPLVIVASTLAIVILFQPLRQRIQIIIDRRFYRHKYDAAHTLEAFSATMQNEVELTQLSERLLSVVNETIQPTQVSLWLRPPQWGKQEPAPPPGSTRSRTTKHSQH